MTNKLYPRCHPYWYKDGKKIYNNDSKGCAYTARGYLLPCCWCDRDDPKDVKQFEYFGFYENDLKVENVDDVTAEILWSPEWLNFHKTLIEEPEHAPNVCKIKCGNFEHSSENHTEKIQ